MTTPLPTFVASEAAVNAASRRLFERLAPGGDWDAVHPADQLSVKQLALDVLAAASEQQVAGVLQHLTVNHKAFGFTPPVVDALIDATVTAQAALSGDDPLAGLG